MDINIKIDAPGLEGAIHTLAQVLANYELPAGNQSEAAVETPKAEIKKEEKPKTETKKEESKAEKTEDKQTISLEVVRAKLAELSQAGKQKEVKALITGFDAKKLTEVPEEKYPELLGAAEKL